MWQFMAAALPVTTRTQLVVDDRQDPEKAPAPLLTT